PPHEEARTDSQFHRKPVLYHVSLLLQHRCDLAQLPPSQKADSDFLTSSMTAHNPLQVARLRHGLILCSDDDIQALEFGSISWPIGADFEQLHARRLRKMKTASQDGVELHTHATNAERHASRWGFSFLCNTCEHRLHSLQRNGETKPLCHRHHRC